MKILRTFALTTLLCSASAAALAQAAVDCEDAGKAQAFAADFDQRLKAAIASGKEQEKANQQHYEQMVGKFVAAGAWTRQEADAYLANIATTDPESAALEVKRAKATKELKTLLLALDGLPIVAGGDKAAERRGTCILGQKALAQAALVYDTANTAWGRVNAQIAALGKEKGVSGF